jgi:hypothetical protein
MKKFDCTHGSASVEMLECAARGYPINVEVCCYVPVVFCHQPIS